MVQASTRINFCRGIGSPSEFLSLSGGENIEFHENQPVGTVIKHLSATMFQSPNISFALIDDFGANQLFHLESNGTLKSAVIFDYENSYSESHTYTIRVQAKDEFNATIDESINISITDIYEPSQPNHFVDLNSTVSLEMIWWNRALLPWEAPLRKWAGEPVRSSTMLL